MVRCRKRRKPARDRDCRQNHQQIVDWHTEVTGTQSAVDQVGAVKRPWICTPNKFENILENENQRKCQQQLKALVAPIDAAQNALDWRADKPKENSRNNKSRKYQPRRDAELRRVANKGNAEIGAERVKRAAGEIDDLLNTEDEL